MDETQRLAKNAYMREWKRANKSKVNGYNQSWKDRHREQVRAAGRDYQNRQWGEAYDVSLLRNCKSRAKQKGLAFNLEAIDVLVPDLCPVLGIPLVPRSGSFHDNSPSIDRLIPEKGYVKGNVKVISYRANRIKCHATIDDIRLILAYMEREG
jgi:hypothetical protein